MIAKVIDILDHVVIVEYLDSEERLQRRYVNREVLPLEVKNIEIEIDGRHLSHAIDYSDVDLVEYFGEFYLNHPVNDLQEALKKQGLWTRSEYLKYPHKIAYVLRSFPGIDVQTIQNSTRRL
jgi:hypothetical protein